MISMVEQPLLGWAGRFAYLTAWLERANIELYAMDLVYLIAKKSYDGLKQPSDLYYKRAKIDNRTGKQIIEDLVKNLGGE